MALRSALLLLFLSLAPCHAIILYGGDNSANLTDPHTGVPWQSVAQLPGGGSAVYLGDGWMLTARHVTLGSTATFDGATFYQIDSGSTQNLPDNVDLKLFRLTTTPSIAGATLLATPSEITNGELTMIGWGVGRNAAPVGSATVGWGDTSTIAKRWGLNALKQKFTLDSEGFSYSALGSYQGTPSGGGLGANEAAATLYDSGGGVFQQINGTWFLVGITTEVSELNAAHFGQDRTSLPRGDGNYSVRISSYASEITQIIPEPSTCVLLGLAILALVSRFAKLSPRPIMYQTLIRNAPLPTPSKGPTVGCLGSRFFPK